MTTSAIDDTLKEIAGRFADSRLDFFDLTADQPLPDRCLLSGTVLDKTDLEEIVRELSARLPEIVFDSENVHVLRREPAQRLGVSTNLAGFFRQPSRTTELLSQLLNGVVVEQLREEDSWVFVRQEDGYLGWVQRAYVTSEIAESAPTHMVSAPVALMVAKPGERQELVSRVFAGTAVRVSENSGAWAWIDLAGSHSGWVPVEALCPLNSLPQTAVEKRAKMVHDVRPYSGVPYRWGGCTVYGIDCSGLMQLLHRLASVTIPRDADMQFAAGTPVDPPFQAGDLLYFGNKDSDRAITHVGMSLGGWEIVHSSGPRNGVYKDDVQAVSWLREAFVGANQFLTAKR